MTRGNSPLRTLLAAGVVMLAPLSADVPAFADPSRYPQFAQQSLPADIKPSFISIDELVNELKTGEKPVIIDVRTEEEYRELHILGAQSAPLTEFRAYLKSIPRGRPVVLY